MSLAGPQRDYAPAPAPAPALDRRDFVSDEGFQRMMAAGALSSGLQHAQSPPSYAPPSGPPPGHAAQANSQNNIGGYVAVAAAGAAAAAAATRYHDTHSSDKRVAGYNPPAQSKSHIPVGEYVAAATATTAAGAAVARSRTPDKHDGGDIPPPPYKGEATSRGAPTDFKLPHETHESVASRKDPSDEDRLKAHLDAHRKVYG